MVIHMFVQAANVSTPGENWQVQESDDSGGANPSSCSGDLSTQIVAPPPTISNISVSSIGPTSVTINWDTDVESNSKVNYGSDDSYGKSSGLNSDAVSSHSVKLTNLAANTNYHFQVVSTTPGGGSASSGDSTFLTAVEQVGITKTITLPGLAVQVTNPADKTPPTITLISKLPKVVQSVPVIKGTAGDDLGVVRIEYSTDGGHNWLPVDNAPKLGGKAVDFSFTPANLDDGNYVIEARAIDAGGNIAVTSSISVVVDRLPPLVGGSVLALGPQVLQAGHDGVISTLTGIDEKITLSAVGGATSINLVAQDIKDTQKSQSFSLTQSADTGLWSGIISFQTSGTYTLTANAVDGAGNKTSKVINYAVVAAPARTIDQKTKQAVSAKITVYYLQPESDNWVVWDGAAYGQANPQATDKNGDFSLFLPAGQYYLSAGAKGYHSLTSSIFKLSRPTPVLTTLAMRPGRDLKLAGVDLSKWDFLAKRVSLNLNDSQSALPAGANNLSGQITPNFNLTDTNGHKVVTTDLLGKPTSITFLSTWAPSSAEQLSALGTMQNNRDINVELVALQQNAEQVQAFDKMAGYNLTWLSDADSSLTNLFNVPSLPTHYFIDRKGIIRKVVSGVLTQQQILEDLKGL